MSGIGIGLGFFIVGLLMVVSGNICPGFACIVISVFFIRLGADQTSVDPGCHNDSWDKD
jgi:hypothetical protein